MVDVIRSFIHTHPVYLADRAWEEDSNEFMDQLRTNPDTLNSLIGDIHSVNSVSLTGDCYEISIVSRDILGSLRFFGDSSTSTTETTTNFSSHQRNGLDQEEVNQLPIFQIRNITEIFYERFRRTITRRTIIYNFFRPVPDEVFQLFRQKLLS